MSAYIAVPTADDPYSQYPSLRAVLAPQYAYLPPAEIEALMEGLFGPGAAERYEEDMEGIFDDIGKAFSSAAKDVGRFAAKAAPVVANIGGGVLKGAAAGSALGLPGIIGGAIAGGVGTGLSSYAKGPARQIGNILGTVTNVAGQFSPAGRIGGGLGSAISGLAGGGGKGAAGAAVNALSGLLGGGGAGGALGSLLGGGGAGGALGSLLGGGGAGGALGSLLGGGGAGGALGSLLGGGGAGGAGAALSALTSLFGGSSAATQLMSLLRRPETMQALGALAIGPAGKPTIAMGPAQTPVPTTVFPDLIKHLSEQVVAEAAAISDGAESELRYMTDETGEYIGDPASEMDRAARLWELLNEAQAERVLGAIYQQAAESADEAAYCPHCGEDLYGAPEYEELYGFTAEDLDEDYTEDLGEDFPGYYDSEWDEDTPYEYA